MEPEETLRGMGLTLPAPPTPFASYRTAVRTGNLLVVAGQGPVRDGKFAFQGKVGDKVSLEQAKEAAQLCALNALAVARAHLGSLGRVQQVVQATVWVACTPDFVQQPQVADGCTDLLKALWGEQGLPARAAVGTNVLPLDITVEVALTFEVR